MRPDPCALVCRSKPIRGVAIAIAFLGCGGAVATVDESAPAKSSDASPSGEGSGASRSDSPPPPPLDASVQSDADTGMCMTLDSSKFDNSCQVDDDCMTATGGTFCDGKGWCMCPAATISVSEKARYDDALNQITSTLHPGPMPCMCPFFGHATCIAGSCTLCGGAAGMHAGCPDGG